MEKKRKFIIDCDTGTDDVIAVIAAFGCDSIEVQGITSVNGNVPERYTSANNRNLVHYLGRDVPVCHGAVRPLLGGTVNAISSIHGPQGLGSTVLPEAKVPFHPLIASEFIFETAKRCGGDLELLVTGPMTNIAVSLIEYPQLRSLIRRIYFMGGSTIGGNMNTTAEFNIWADPEAAHIVFCSGIPLTMVGLNVSNQAEMRSEEEQILREFGTREGTLAADMIAYMQNRSLSYTRYARMHDPLALAAAVFPECMKYESYFGDTECRGVYTRGHTAIDILNRNEGAEKNITAAVELDVERFRHWLIEAIRQSGRHETGEAE